MTRLYVYGRQSNRANMAAVGKSKAVPRLAARMPSREVLAKVGNAGGGKFADRKFRVVRINAKAVSDGR